MTGILDYGTAISARCRKRFEFLGERAEISSNFRFGNLRPPDFAGGRFFRTGNGGFESARIGYLRQNPREGYARARHLPRHAVFAGTLCSRTGRMRGSASAAATSSAFRRGKCPKSAGTASFPSVLRSLKGSRKGASSISSTAITRRRET